MKKLWKLYVASAIIVFVLPAIILIPYSKKQQRKISDDPTVSTVNEENVVPTELTVTVVDENQVVQSFSVDEYLVGVVLSEMPADFEPEALKAQAVVARTYTLRRKDKIRKHDTADICTEPGCCQGYISPDDYLKGGGSEASVEKIRNAVTSTRGIVVTYQGELAEATYFSCSGGKTEDAAAVWGSDVPYLQATQSPGEEKATHFTDTVHFTATQFREKLGRDMEGAPANWVENISYTEGGGVDVMRICGVDYKGTELRNMLGLRSTAFRLTAVGDTITITTKGFGHRVGMSQYGADAMAVQGASYEEILTYYYNGVEVSTYQEG